MSEILSSMVDAMLLEETTPEQIIEIGRMAAEGAGPTEPDEDDAPIDPQADEWVKSMIRGGGFEAKPSETEPAEQEPKPTPEPAPIKPVHNSIVVR